MELRGPFPQECGGPFSTEGGYLPQDGGHFRAREPKKLDHQFHPAVSGNRGKKGRPKATPPNFPRLLQGIGGKMGESEERGNRKKRPETTQSANFCSGGGPEKRPGAAQVAKNPESGNRKKLTTPLPKIPHCFGVSGGEMGFFRNRIAGGGLVLRVAIIYLYRASRN